MSTEAVDRETRRFPARELLISLVTTLLLLAVVDRVLARIYPAFEISGSMFVADEELGWKLRPSHVIPEKGLRTNSSGFRGEEFERRGDGPLVAFIGDSVTYGATTNDMTFPRQLEDLAGWQTYNFGMPNYGPLEYARIAPRVARHQPDVVVVGVFIGNDIADCRAGRNKEFREKKGETNSWAWSGIYRFLLFRGVVTWEPMERALAAAADTEFDSRGPRRTEDQFTTMELARMQVFKPAAYRDRWTCLEESLGALIRELPAAHLLILPDEMQVNDELWGHLIEKAADPGRFDRGFPGRRLWEIGVRLGLPVVDPTEALRAEGERTYFQWDSHPNPHGNRIIAEVLREGLQAGAVPGS